MHVHAHIANKNINIYIYLFIYIYYLYIFIFNFLLIYLQCIYIYASIIIARVEIFRNALYGITSYYDQAYYYVHMNVNREQLSRLSFLSAIHLLVECIRIISGISDSTKELWTFRRTCGRILNFAPMANYPLTPLWHICAERADQRFRSIYHHRNRVWSRGNTVVLN